MANSDPSPGNAPKASKKILNTGLWLAGIFIVGLVFKLILGLTIDGEKNKERSRMILANGIETAGNGNHQEAIDLFTSAVKLDTANTQAYLYRGISYYQLKNYENALTDLNKVVVTDRTIAQAYLYRGNVYFNQKAYSKAFDEYAKAIEAGANADAYIGKGNVYVEMGNPLEAIRCYIMAIDLSPDYGAAYFARGNAYNRQGDYDNALTDFGRAMELEPDNEQYKQQYEFALKLKGGAQ